MIKLISKYKVIALVILLIIVNFLIIFGQSLLPETDTVQVQLQEHLEEEGRTGEAELKVSNVEMPSLVQEVPVYVCGAVNQAGVYHVKLPGIIQDVITLAGGMTMEADVDALNLAAPLVGNEKIYVPMEGEVVEERPTIGTITNTTGKININTADQNTLESLPGIGPAKAKQIMDYRQSYGTFKAIEALQDVSGIGTKTFEGLKDLITIE
ncbi:MAG: helix-hairpin-helix domain-containing protein [Cellulosilyticaceae bacterium]